MEVKKSKVSAKGLTTIPKEIREALNITVGCELSWEIKDDTIIVKPIENPVEFLKARFNNISYEEAEEMTDDLLSSEVDSS